MTDVREFIMSKGVGFPWMGMRYICDVLTEMRRCDSTKNYAPLVSLIEEAQTMASSMEDALGTVKEIQQIRDTQKVARRLANRYKKEMEKEKPDMKKVDSILKEMREL